MTITTSALTPTSKSLSCDDSNVEVNEDTACTATVTAADGSNPSGTVTFVSSGSGNFHDLRCGNGEGDEGDDQSDSSSLECQVKYTPTEAGQQTITASYPGDNLHSGSSGTFNLTVVPEDENDESDSQTALPSTNSGPPTLSMAALFSVAAGSGAVSLVFLRVEGFRVPLRPNLSQPRGKRAQPIPS